MSSKISYYAASAFSHYPKESGERVIYKANDKIDTSSMSEKEIESFIKIGKLKQTLFDSLAQEKEYQSIASRFSSILSELETSSSRTNLISSSKEKIFSLYEINSLESDLAHLEAELEDSKKTNTSITQEHKKALSELVKEKSDLDAELAKTKKELEKSNAEIAKGKKEIEKLTSVLDKATK